MIKKVILGIIIALLIAIVIIEGVFLYKEKSEPKSIAEEQKNEIQTIQDKENENDNDNRNYKDDDNDYSNYQYKDNDNTSVTNGEMVTVFKMRNPNKPEANDEQTVRPYDAYTYEYYNVIDNLNFIGFQYYIPQIYIRTKNKDGKKLEDIERINDEILKEWEGIIKETEKKQVVNMERENLNYRCYYDNELMTLLLTSSDESSDTMMKSYIIDSTTGKELSNEEIIQKFGFSKEKVKTKLISIIENYSQNIIKNIESQSDLGHYNELVEKAKQQVQETSIDDFEFIIVGNGELCVFIKTYNLHFAGGDTAGFLFNLETGEELLYKYTY